MFRRRGRILIVFLLAVLIAPVLVAAQGTEGRLIRNDKLASERISDSDIKDSRVNDSDLYGVHLRGVVVERSRLENVAVTNATLRASTVTRATLFQVTIDESELTSTWIEGGTLNGGSLTDSAVRRVTFNGARVCNVLIVAENRIDNSGCGTPANGTPVGPSGATPTPPAGGSTPVPASTTSVFATDERTLARFEFNGDVRDNSGSGRDLQTSGATPSYVNTRFGQGIRIGAQGPALNWTPYSGLLFHPFTVEMVFTPDAVGGYQKLLSPNDATDNGWYVYGDGFISYPSGATLAGGQITAGTQHSLTLVSTSPTNMDVYVDGARVDNTPINFDLPPGHAIFFRDDRSGGEQLVGTVDAMRISTGARSQAEISAVQARLTG